MRLAYRTYGLVAIVLVVLACSGKDEVSGSASSGSSSGTATGGSGGDGAGASSTAGAGGVVVTISTSVGGLADYAEVVFPPPLSLTDESEITVVGTSSSAAALSIAGIEATTEDSYYWQVQDVPLTDGYQTFDVGTEFRSLAGFGIERNGVPRRLSRLAVDVQAGRAFVSHAVPSALYELDLSSGDRWLISGGPPGEMVGSGPPFSASSQGLLGLAWDAAGQRVLAIDADALYAVDRLSGARTLVADASIGSGSWPSSPFDLLLDSINNRVLSADRGNDALVAIDLSSGDRTVISDSATGSGPPIENAGGLVLDIANNRVLMLDVDTSCPPCRVLAVDLTSGQRSEVSGDNVGAGSSLSGHFSLAPDLANGRLVAAGSDELTIIELASGDRTPVTWSANGPPQLLMQQIAAGAGTLYAVDYQLNGVLSINPQTGDRALVSAGVIGTGEHLLQPALAEWDLQSYRLLVFDSAAGAIVAVNVYNGARSVISSADVGSGPPLGAVQDLQAADGEVFLASSASGPAVLSVDFSAGQRSVVSDDTIGAGPGFGAIPRALAHDPATQRIYALVQPTNSIDATIFVVDTTNGDRNIVADAMTGIGPPLEHGRDMMFFNGTLLVVTQTALLQIDPATGDRTERSGPTVGQGDPLQVAANPGCGSFASADSSVFVLEDVGKVVAINWQTGDRSPLSTLADRGPLDWMTGLTSDGQSRLWASDSGLGVLAIDARVGERVVLSK